MTRRDETRRDENGQIERLFILPITNSEVGIGSIVQSLIGAIVTTKPSWYMVIVRRTGASLLLLLLLLLLRLLLLATAPLLSSGPDRSAKLKMGSLALPLLEEGPPGPSAKLLANTVIGLH